MLPQQLPSLHGFITGGPQLVKEAVKAINQVQVYARRVGSDGPAQAKLAAFFKACADACAPGSFKPTVPVAPEGLMAPAAARVAAPAAAPAPTPAAAPVKAPAPAPTPTAAKPAVLTPKV